MNPADISESFASHLGVAAQDLTFLRYSQNYVFHGRTGEAERILRVTRDDHRSRAEIVAELEWIRHLHQGGASVAAPALDGIATLALEGITLHGVVFEMAPGRALMRDDLSADLYRAHGRTLGRIHRHSADLPPGWEVSRRPWDEERYFTCDISGYLPAAHQQPLREVFRRLRSRVSGTPSGACGPVHFDLGYSNFFIDEGRITVFDFDNCTTAPRIADIAAALYGSIFTLLRCEFPGDRSAFEHPKSGMILREMLPAFREGYSSAFPWPSDWETQLQPWLDLLYFRSVIHAWRIQSPVANPGVLEALEVDVENLLNGKTPVRFEG